GLLIRSQRSEVRGRRSEAGGQRPELGDRAGEPEEQAPGLMVTMENDETLFYAHRERFNDLLRNGAAESAETAALFYYLNRTAFNGLCRLNSRGEFNVPFGQYKSIRYIRDFTPYRQPFDTWEFTSGDFESVPLADED